MWIFRRTFWRTVWIDVQRSPRDRRSRAFLLKFALVLLYWFGAVPGAIWAVSSGRGFELSVQWYLMLYAGLLGGVVLLRWFQGSAARSRAAGAVAESPIRRYLEDRARIVAALLIRGAGDVRAQAPGEQVVGSERPNANSAMRHYGLWDSLDPNERKLLSAAEGTWTFEEMEGTIAWAEQLRLLRWVLCLDPEIAPLAHFPSIDMRLIDGVLYPAGPFPSKGLLAPSDVRPERDTALYYLNRTVAELIARGQAPSDPALQEWAQAVHKNYGDASTDFLAGAKTIGELDDSKLRRLCLTAAARERYAAYLVELLGAPEPFPFPKGEDGSG